MTTKHGVSPTGPASPQPPPPSFLSNDLRPITIAPRAASERVQARVCRDRVQPGADAGPALEGLAPAPGLHQRLLHEILCVLDRPEHPVAMDLQLTPVALGGFSKPGLIHGARR